MSTQLRYPHILPNINDWPINRFSLKRKEFVQHVEADVMKYIESLSEEELDQLIARTIYLEKQRIKANPWKVDPPNEMQYFRKIQNEFNENQSSPKKSKAHKETAFRLIKRYAEEITGHFNPVTFRHVRNVSSFIFHFLLFPLSFRSFFGLKRMTQRNAEALKVVGEIETLRTLFKDHTVVLVCTHSSNLDSLLIGYTMDLVGGVPAFSYGAGLNLFDSEFFAYFMNRLGAYKIDRRKKNVMYLQTLNSYSKLSILEEVNTIFFPGGTRSRSGEVEQKLKLGLLNSLLLAQRILIEKKSNHKIIVFPVVLSYESVLEARSLIFQHLRGEGQEKFTTRERTSSLGQYFKFIQRLIFQGSKIYLSIGQPLDVFGNRVNSLGESIDHKGKPLDLKSYFLRNGEMITDSQRESIYTRELSEKIATEYKYSNYILPCHVAAYTAFKILAKTNPSLDVYGLVQLPEEEYVFPKKAFYALFEEIRGILFHLAGIHKLIYPDTLEGELQSVAESGIQQLGIYHIKRVLNIDSFDRLISEDFLALMYYANKLNNLQIGELINWDKIPLDQEELR